MLTDALGGGCGFGEAAPRSLGLCGQGWAVGYASRG